MKRAERHNIPSHHRQRAASKQQVQPAISKAAKLCKQANLHIPPKKWEAMLADLQHHQAELAMRGVFLDGLPDGTEHTERSERKVKWLLRLLRSTERSRRNSA